MSERSKPSWWAANGHWVVFGLMAIVCVVTFLGVRTARSMRTPPAWWAQVARLDDDAADAGRDLENAITTQLHLRRDPGEQWKVAIRSDQANAWLAERLPGWAAQQFAHSDSGGEPDPSPWPDELKDIRVLFGDAQIMLGARLERDGHSQYLSAVLEPELRGDGSLWVRAQTVHIGDLSFSASEVLARAQARAGSIMPGRFGTPGEAIDFFRVLAGELPASEQPAIKLSDGRRVRLLGLRPMQDGRLALTCRTESDS